MTAPLVVVRGAGDLASGVIWRLARAGWPVIACELAEPLTVRRTVAFSAAVADGRAEVEGVTAILCDGADEAISTAERGDVAVLVSPTLPPIEAAVVVDARLAKRNIDTTIDDAPLVIGLGPGFEAGTDVHAVIETKRGHRLGRALWHGSAAPNTGIPGTVGGRAAERVLRAPADGAPRWTVAIGEVVTEGQPLGSVAGTELTAPFAGVVRGLLADGVEVAAGTKIGDVDPRADPAACFEISDKALAVAGGVLEAILTDAARSRTGG